jgi:hypothetical protein
MVAVAVVASILITWASGRSALWNLGFAIVIVVLVSIASIVAAHRVMAWLGL